MVSTCNVHEAQAHGVCTTCAPLYTRSHPPRRARNGRAGREREGTVVANRGNEVQREVVWIEPGVAAIERDRADA